MTPSDDPWKRLVEASKGAPKQEDSTPPPKISVSKLRQSVRTLLLALTWQKWSLLAAVVAVIIFFLLYQNQDPDSPSSSPIIELEPIESPIEP